MGQFQDAIDKQFPPKTDQERAEYSRLNPYSRVRALTRKERGLEKA